MKKSKSKILSLVMSLVLMLTTAFCLSACGGGTKTLESYINDNPSVKKQIEGASQSDSTMEMSIDIKENDLIYTYKYKQVFEADVVKQMNKQFETYASNFETTFSNIAKSLEEETKISGITVYIVYQNGDGSEIFKQSYTAKK
ncbi:MAG: DUF4854 domain-containing protein [Coprobacillus sp.]|nr:DUF4854 domain-containing protein [Coprobacillus sp.]MCI9093039.1 DUF4854 domain-containing protein [Coprobacillus sp.]